MDTLKLLEYGMLMMNNNLGMCRSDYDVQETDEKYILSIKVPGLREQDIDIKIKNDKRLIIKSKRSNKFTSDFTYTFIIPVKINREETYARVENGVLEVFLVKVKDEEFDIKIK